MLRQPLIMKMYVMLIMRSTDRRKRRVVTLFHSCSPASSRLHPSTLRGNGGVEWIAVDVETTRRAVDRDAYVK